MTPKFKFSKDEENFLCINDVRAAHSSTLIATLEEIFTSPSIDIELRYDSIRYEFEGVATYTQNFYTIVLLFRYELFCGTEGSPCLDLFADDAQIYLWGITNEDINEVEDFCNTGSLENAALVIEDWIESRKIYSVKGEILTAIHDYFEKNLKEWKVFNPNKKLRPKKK